MHLSDLDGSEPLSTRTDGCVGPRTAVQAVAGVTLNVVALDPLGDERPAEVEPAVPDLGFGERSLLDTGARSNQMDNLDLPCREQIRNESPVTAPR
jgi:hypothetical protein